MSEFQMDLIAVQGDRKDPQGEIRFVEARPGLEVEAVAVARTGEVAVLDNAGVERCALVRTLILASEDLSLDVDQQQFQSVDRNRLLTEIRYVTGFGDTWHGRLLMLVPAAVPAVS